MKYLSTPLVALFVLFAASGCSGESGDDDGTGGTGATGGSGASGGSGATGGSGGSGGMTCGTNVIASSANNYQFSSTLSFPAVTVKPDTELTFEWGGVTKDFLKHDMSPTADVDTVNLMLWKLTQEELEEKLNADELQMRDLAIPAKFPTGNTVTTAQMFDFLTAASAPVTDEEFLSYLSVANYAPAENTYTVMLATGDLLAAGGVARMIQTFKLDPASTNTTVTLTNTSTTLMYTANLHSLTPTVVPAGQAGITVDWTNMTTTSLGTEFNPNQITEIRVARYNETPTELEAKFLDLELIATDTYEAEVLSGTSFSLSGLMSSTGAPFPGISTSGTWALALICGACRNPAPWYMTVMQPCP